MELKTKLNFNVLLNAGSITLSKNHFIKSNGTGYKQNKMAV